ncbi:MgtC/SapB family protein [Pseudoduganella ginsengisoli]
MPAPADALNLLASFAAGLVIGIERGWNQRQRNDGERVAGLRTFSLVGILGGVLVLLSGPLTAWGLLGTVLGLSLLLALAWRETARTSGDFSITTAVALLLTLMLGAAAMHGHVAVALAAAVVVAVMLDLKSTLHRWLRLIEHRELAAALQLLVLSVVILPNLPNTGLGPYRALNPYQLWWAVVLIAGLSLAGHCAMRAAGYQRGLFLTGILGGLASSTAATLSLARLARREPGLSSITGASALASCAVMYFRLFILLLAIQPALLKTTGPALLTTGGTMLLTGIWHWRRANIQVQPGSAGAAIAPFDLSTALVFGGFLGVMAVAVPAAKDALGAGGVYTASALSGLLDVDAIVISIARIHRASGITDSIAVISLSLAVFANMAVKAGMAWVAGGRAIGLVVSRGYGIALLAGAVPVVLAMA